METTVEIKTLRDGDKFSFNGDEYLFDRLMGHDSAYAFNINAGVRDILSRHTQVTVKK